MKLSIVTINRNNAEGLRRTLASVAAQTNHEIEHVIVDGASSDDSVDVIKEYAQKLDNGDWRLENFQWISEPDSGIYNAMNKGLRMCHGEYTLMLNSGDYLVDEHVIARIMPELDGTDIVQGNIIVEKEGRKWRNKSYGKSDISFLDVYRGYFLHQAAFCRCDLYERCGYYEEDYKYVSDTAFFLVALGYRNATFKYVNIDITNFDMHGFSSSTDPSISVPYRKERFQMQADMIPWRLQAFCREVERKEELYDILKSHWWIWKLTMLLKMISQIIYGKRKLPIEEEIE